MDRCLGSLAHPNFVTSSSVMGDVTTALFEIRAVDVSATQVLLEENSTIAMRVCSVPEAKLVPGRLSLLSPLCYVVSG